MICVIYRYTVTYQSDGDSSDGVTVENIWGKCLKLLSRVSRGGG